jgi:hypothetical protein
VTNGPTEEDLEGLSKSDGHLKSFMLNEFHLYLNEFTSPEVAAIVLRSK